MKKVLAILAISFVFASCGNEASTEDAAQKAADSTRVADSLAKVAADAAAAADSATKAAADTVKAAADSLKK